MSWAPGCPRVKMASSSTSRAFPAQALAKAAPGADARLPESKIVAPSPAHSSAARLEAMWLTGANVPASAAPNPSSKQRIARCLVSGASDPQRRPQTKSATRSVVLGAGIGIPGEQEALDLGQIHTGDAEVLQLGALAPIVHLEHDAQHVDHAPGCSELDAERGRKDGP